LLEAKLIACTNIHSKGLSIDSWKNQTTYEDKEVYVSLKTSQDREIELREKLSDIHSYDCPCMITIKPEKVNAEYYTYITTILET
jgi:periplasmic divalent cation tolerance protein